MTWLIRLYPPAWRRRYGRELAELIATQPASFGTAIDLVAGAVDAWLNPQSSTAATAADAKGAGAMVPKMLQLRCAGHGPDVTAADAPQGRRGDDWRNPRAGACLDVGHGALREQPLSRIAPCCLVARAAALQPTLHVLEGTPGPRAGSAHRRPRGDRDCHRSGGRLDQHSDLIRIEEQRNSAVSTSISFLPTHTGFS